MLWAVSNAVCCVLFAVCCGLWAMLCAACNAVCCVLCAVPTAQLQDTGAPLRHACVLADGVLQGGNAMWTYRTLYCEDQQHRPATRRSANQQSSTKDWVQVPGTVLYCIVRPGIGSRYCTVLYCKTRYRFQVLCLSLWCHCECSGVTAWCLQIAAVDAAGSEGPWSNPSDVMLTTGPKTVL